MTSVWPVFILAEMIVGTHFWQVGYQGYAELLTTALAGLCFTLAFVMPVYYLAGATAGVALATLFLTGTTVYWSRRRRRRRGAP